MNNFCAIALNMPFVIYQFPLRFFRLGLVNKGQFTVYIILASVTEKGAFQSNSAMLIICCGVSCLPDTEIKCCIQQYGFNLWRHTYQ